jgi:hypothetical protein
MAHPIDNSFAKLLEFLILAITVGSSFWLTLLASGALNVFNPK